MLNSSVPEKYCQIHLGKKKNCAKWIYLKYISEPLIFFIVRYTFQKEDILCSIYEIPQTSCSKDFIFYWTIFGTLLWEHIMLIHISYPYPEMALQSQIWLQL